MRAFFILGALLAVTACAGSTKGSEAGIGFDAMNTQSKEEKAEEKWFDNFYGSKHCTWGSGCAADGTSSDSD